MNISSQFDNLLAKVIVHHQDRKQMLQITEDSLKKFIIHGVKTNKKFLLNLLKTRELIEQKAHVRFIESSGQSLLNLSPIDSDDLACLCIIHKYFFSSNNFLYAWRSDFSPFYLFEGQTKTIFYSLKKNDSDDGLQISLNGKSFHLKSSGENQFLLDTLFVHYYVGNDTCYADIDGTSVHVSLLLHKDVKAQKGEVVVTSPMSGKLSQILVKNNQMIQKGDALFTVEAMKMQMAVTSPADGRVIDILSNLGDQVKNRQMLAKLFIGEEI